jgi:hypothetical protein
MMPRKYFHLITLLLLFCVLPGCSDKPQPAFETIICRSPSGDRTAKHVFKWRFDTVRESVLKTLSQHDDMTLKKLVAVLNSEYSQEMRDSLQDVRGCIETVVLEMEARGEIERLPASSEALPERVRLKRS